MYVHNDKCIVNIQGTYKYNLQIPGYKYICELIYPSGLTIVTETIEDTPSNNSQIRCQIEHNQVSESSYSIQIYLSLLIRSLFPRHLQRE